MNINNYMITDEELLLIKEKVWDKVKKYSCGIELCGSKCLDFIENCHDIDIAVLYNKDKNKEILRKIIFKDNSHKNGGIPLKIAYNICVKIRPINFMQEKNFSLTYIYQYAYKKILFGKGMIQINNEDMFNISEDVLNKVKNFIQNMLLNKKYSKNKKCWYHVYAWLCCVNKKSFEFTEEEKKNINILHSCLDEEDKLKKWCCEQLNIEFKEY